MQKYCDGPEVDANFVLLDGETLFLEVCDDFLKSADVNGTGGLNTFIELDSIFPSSLLPQELNLIRNSFHKTLLRLGLDSGILHVEGRVQDSTTEYRDIDEIIDLHPRLAPTKVDPSDWLIEINPRPPGKKGSQIIEYTHGVDYWGLAMLIALCDKDRMRALSHTFQNGHQYWRIMVFIPTDYPVDSCEGVFDCRMLDPQIIRA